MSGLPEDTETNMPYTIESSYLATYSDTMKRAPTTYCEVIGANG